MASKRPARAAQAGTPRKWAAYALALCAGLSGCGAPSAQPPRSGGARPPAAASPMTARPKFGGWLLAPEGPAGTEVQSGPDGTRSFILRGTRWLDHPDGSIARARQVFHEEDVKATQLPARLGGGYLFYVTSGSSTSLWRADSWTGDLRPLGRVDPPVSTIISGFDRLYLGSATSHTLRSLDPWSGKALDLAPLPHAAAYGDMVFADAWRAVVLSGGRGALATFDAGETWYPLAAPDEIGELRLGPSGSILVGTDAGQFELDATGRLVQTSARGSDALFRDADRYIRYPREAFPAAPAPGAKPPPPLGRRPLRAAVLRGFPDTPNTAVVIERGMFGRVRLDDGAVLSSEPFAGRTPCRGVALGLGFGFVCGDGHGPTDVYAYRHGRLELDLTLDGPHSVRSSGNGALVLGAPCAVVRRDRAQRGAAPAPAAGSEQRVARYCVRQVSGDLFDVRVRGDVGSERITALRDGRVAVLIPPRAGAVGRLSIVSASGTSGSDLELMPDAGPGARLVRSGLWLDDVWEVSEGMLGAWVVGARAFVGVHIDLKGVVQIAHLQEGVDETSFYGPHALHLAASASLRESSDHGFDWRVSELPAALLASASAAAPRRPVRGCSAVGCVHDDWVRIGFSAEGEAPEPARPEPPPRVSYATPGFAFWTLSCESQGVVLARGATPRAPLVMPGATGASQKSGRARRGEAPESSAWFPFQATPAPSRKPADLGYDFGEINENGAYRAYAWGPTGDDWGRRSTWQVKVGDRFSIAPPWSTRVTRSPWNEASSAAQAFGLDPSTGVDWWLRLGSRGDSGVLQIRVRSESSLHLVDRDRSITTLRGATADFGTIAGAYEVRDRWYVGASRAEQFQLYRVEQGRLELVATYPLYGRVVTQLVRSVHGDELALWQKSSGLGWHVLPIDLTTFEPAPALFIPLERLGTTPPLCAPEHPGWLAVAGVPLTDSGVSESNTHLDFSGGAEGLRTKRLTARVVIDESGVCVDALSALSEGAIPTDLRAQNADASRAALPLTVIDPASETRAQFRCSR